MANYVEILPENQQIFNRIISGVNLSGVNIKILANNAQKEIGKVVKANDLVKHMTNEDVVIIINEVIYDKLEPLQKEIVADDLIVGIHQNPDTSRIVINKPDMHIYAGVVRKYTFPVYERLYETIKSLFDIEKNKKESGAEPTELEDEDEKGF